MKGAVGGVGTGHGGNVKTFPPPHVTLEVSA